MSSDDPSASSAVATPRRARGSGLLWLVVLAALALGGWKAYDWWQAHYPTATGARGTTTPAGEGDGAAPIGDPLVAISALRREQHELAQRMSDATSSQQVLRDEVLGVGERAALLEQSVSRIASPRAQGEQALRLDEAELLLTIGQQQVELSSDIGSALHAYALADATLAGSSDPSVVNLRQSLAQEIAAMQGLPPDPRATLAGELDALDSSLDASPFADGAPAQPARATVLDRVVGSMVEVHRSQAQDLLDPASREGALTAVRLEVTLARLALERRDASAFHAALARIERWLPRLYAPATVARQRQLLTQLQRAPLRIDLPSLGGTLVELRRLRQAQPVAPAADTARRSFRFLHRLRRRRKTTVAASMKLFRSLLFCLALAVIGALLWQQFASDQGQVIVSLHGTTYITTVTKALLILALAMGALWILVLLLRLPFQLWRRRQRMQAMARMTGGLLALHEGRWTRAEKLLAQASTHLPFRMAARLGAAQAAQARGDTAAFEQHLVAASDDAGDHAAGLARAQAHFDADRAQEAIAVLDAAAEKAPPSPRGLLLRVRALVASRRAAEAYGMLGALRSAQALTPTDLAALEGDLAAQALREAVDANALADHWDRLLPELRGRSDVVAAYAQRAAGIGMEDAAANAIADALKNRWDDALALEYGRIPAGRNTSPTARLQSAEGWLRAHSDSAALALTLGRLSAALQQWGKAEDYLHRAIAQGAGAGAWEELGHVHAALNDDASARQCYANALRAARGEPVLALSGRGVREQIFDVSVIEERSEHGVPRLPG